MLFQVLYNINTKEVIFYCAQNFLCSVQLCMTQCLWISGLDCFSVFTYNCYVWQCAMRISELNYFCLFTKIAMSKNVFMNLLTELLCLFTYNFCLTLCLWIFEMNFFHVFMYNSYAWHCVFESLNSTIFVCSRIIALSNEVFVNLWTVFVLLYVMRIRIRMIVFRFNYCFHFPIQNLNADRSHNITLCKKVWRYAGRLLLVAFG